MNRLIRFVQRHAPAVRIATVVTIALVGGVGIALLAPGGGRAVAGFIGGLVAVSLAFEFGKFNIRLAARIQPSLTLAVAMLSYVSTVVALGLVLVVSRPEVVDGRAVACGLLAGLVVTLAAEIAEAWVVQEHR